MYTARLPYRERLTRSGGCSWDLYVAAGGHRASLIPAPSGPSPSKGTLDDGQGDPCLRGHYVTDRQAPPLAIAWGETTRRTTPHRFYILRVLLALSLATVTRRVLGIDRFQF